MKKPPLCEAAVRSLQASHDYFVVSDDNSFLSLLQCISNFAENIKFPLWSLLLR